MSGEVVDQWGKNEFAASPSDSSLGMTANLCAGSEAPGNLYVSNSVSGSATGPPQSKEAFLRAYGTDPIGCFKARTGEADEIEELSARLNGEVLPKGLEVSECRFEYGATSTYGQQAPCVPGAAEISESSEAEDVQAQVEGLQEGTVYHFRLVAKVGGELETGSDVTFKTLGPPVISGEGASGITDTEARLKALVNPEGFETDYHFEYGPTDEYGQSTPTISVGSDRKAHAVAADLAGLAPGTEYHWRIVAENDSGTTKAADVLNTYLPPAEDTDCPNQALRTGPSAFLPDCRAYELVSPLDKNGADVVVPGEEGGYVRSRPDGGKLTYTANAAFAGAPSASYNNQYIATRGAGGWAGEGIHPPVGGEPATFVVFGLIREFMAFTPDLCSGWLVDYQTPPPTVDGQPDYQNLYRRENCEPGKGGLEALTPSPPTLPGDTNEGYVNSTSVQGVSDDGRQTLFVTQAALPHVPEASIATGASGFPIAQTYDRHEGGLSLVSVLPDGAAGDPVPGDKEGFANPTDSAVGSGWTKNLQRAVSSDGSRAYWTGGINNTGLGTIYQRRHPEQGIVAGECANEAAPCTTQVSAGGVTPAFFWAASPDGRKALYSQANELWLFEEGAGSTKLASDILGVVATGETLERTYFVSRGKLGEEKNEAGEEAVEGQPNLYHVDEKGALGFIGTLVEGDMGEFAPGASVAAYDLASTDVRQRPARTSADGAELAFQSRAQLTGFDNDTEGGEAAVEVFRFDAEAGAAGELDCVSCNPAGAQPVSGELFVPYEKFKPNRDTTNVPAAAWIPPWQQSNYASNVLSADGSRLFFNSYDALVPRDSNGAQDVYQWEAPGTGSCTEESPSYFPQNGGCLHLISSGQSPTDSEFWEASPDGDDVFFATASSLANYLEDPGLIDLYDARVGGGYPRSEPAAECEGEACQSPPPAPEDPTPASAAYNGPGNETPSPFGRCRRAARQAQGLARRAGKLRRGAKRAARQDRGAGARKLSGKAKRLTRRARKRSSAAKRCRRRAARASRGAAR